MIRLIFTRKCLIKPQLTQSTLPMNLNKLTYMSFSKKNRLKKSNIRPRSERKEESDNEDNDFEEKRNIEEEKEFRADKQQNDKKSMKDKIAEFFSFTKGKSTYTFADTGGKEIPDDEIDLGTKGGVEFDEDLNEYHIKQANEFMKFMKKEEEITITQEVGKVEEKVEKNSYDLFREYLNVSNDHLVVKETFSNKDFQKEIKPLIDRYISEFNFSLSLLKSIYLRYPKFFTKENTLNNLIKTREFLVKRFNFTNSEIAEIITSKPIMIEYPVEDFTKNLSNLQNFMKINEEELRRLVLEYPFLLNANETKYKESFRYMNLFLNINLDQFIVIVKKEPLILRTDPISIVSVLREISRYRSIPNEKWIECICKNPTIFVLKSMILKNLFTTFSKIGFKSKDTIEFILKYPEFIIANRFEFVHLKIKLLRNLGLSPVSINKFINKYPFIILNYNSFVRKVQYFRKTFNTKLEDEEIFPFIFLFNLKKDIIPRFEIIKKYNRNFNLKTAFELSPEEFVKEIGSNLEEFNYHSRDGFPLYERDILFRYDKFKI